MAEKSDIDILYPDVDLVIGGETITFHPFYYEDWKKVMGFVATLLPIVQQTGMNIPAIVAQGGEALDGLLMYCSGKDQAWLKKRKFGEVLDMATAIVELNREDFAKNILPAVIRLAAAMSGEKEVPAAPVDGEPSTQG